MEVEIEVWREDAEKFGAELKAKVNNTTYSHYSRIEWSYEAVEFAVAAVNKILHAKREPSDMTISSVNSAGKKITYRGYKIIETEVFKEIQGQIKMANAKELAKSIAKVIRTLYEKAEETNRKIEEDRATVIIQL